MRYSVKAEFVTGLGNKKFKAGEVVKDSNFPPGNANALAKAGHLIPLDKPKIHMESEKPEIEAKKKPYKDITTKELKKILGDKDGNGHMKKAELYELYLNM